MLEILPVLEILSRVGYNVCLDCNWCVCFWLCWILKKTWSFLLRVRYCGLWRDDSITTDCDQRGSSNWAWELRYHSVSLARLSLHSWKVLERRCQLRTKNVKAPFTQDAYQICTQICVQTLWCSLQPVWTLPFTAVCSFACTCCKVLRVLCERGLRRCVSDLGCSR